MSRLVVLLQAPGMELVGRRGPMALLAFPAVAVTSGPLCCASVFHRSLSWCPEVDAKTVTSRVTGG